MKYVFIIIFTCVISTALTGQENASTSLLANVKIGAMYYQGDLSPLENKYSSSQANFGVSVGVQYYTKGAFSFYTELLIGRLSGDDMFAKSEDRRRRNLSFKSNIYEVSVGMKYSINKLFKYFDRQGIYIEPLFGGNLFYFNPKTKYKGKWIELQPIATEGQGWAIGSEPKYKRIELGLSLGLEIKFKIKKGFYVGLSFIHKKTYTDYIDDVSTFYINYDEQLMNSSKLSAELGNRTGEYLNTDSIRVKTGTNRGNQEKNDSYLFTALLFSFKI